VRRTGRPEDAAEAEWVSWRVHRALETLPEHERSLVELAYWSGLSQSEIAEYVACPLGTVKTRTRAALRRLADELEESCDERTSTSSSATTSSPASSSASSASTRCSSSAGPRRSCRPQLAAPGASDRARIVPFPRRYRFTAAPRPPSPPPRCSASGTSSGPAGRDP
jgi:sirohydrochlorin ferrochelatase